MIERAISVGEVVRFERIHTCYTLRSCCFPPPAFYSFPQVADPGLALHLSGLKPTKYDNIIAASTTLGSKTTVASACIVGENGVLGDKSSVKRSVIGNNVK